MEKLQNRLSDWNLREINQVKTLLLEFCKTPDLILLHGEFAADTPRSVAGGYEFLVVISTADMVDPEKLMDYITEQYPTPQRLVKRIRVQVISTEFFRANVRINLYLFNIFTQGISVYNCEPRLWEHINERKAVKQKYIQANQEGAKKHLYFADAFLQGAEAVFVNSSWQICPYFLYYAMEQLLIAMELHYYGFKRKYDHLSRHFETVKHGSKRLFEFGETRKSELSKMFRNMSHQKNVCLYLESTGYQLDVMYRYEGIVKEMQDIIERECGLLVDEPQPVPQTEEVPAENTLIAEQV